MTVRSLNLPRLERRSLLDRLKLIAARGHAERTLHRFLHATRNVRAVQCQILREKLSRNADSAFGRDFGLGKIRTPDDFARQVPILSYADLQPYIERVKAGEPRAMFGPKERVHMFAKTSGTTDTPKYIPVSSSFLEEYRRGWNAFGVKVIMDHDCFLRPIVQVSSPMDEEFTSAGIPCGAITGLMAASQKRLVRQYYVVPREVARIPDADARYYCILRFSIAADVAFVITASPATQLRLARTAERRGEALLCDVHDGTLCPTLDLPAALRLRLESRLRPDRTAALRLKDCLRLRGSLLPKDFWDLSFLGNWRGGTMGLHLRDFPKYFGDVPGRDIGLLASEGRMSIPLEDGTASGVLNVTDNYYEFIPAEEYGGAAPTVLKAHELEEGGEYFILLTTSAGFYRYDIGDCVRVTGFYDSTPLIEFLHKGLHTSSVTGEKLTERQVVMAYDACAGRFHLRGRSFVLAPRWAETPYYRLHLDVRDFDAPVEGALADAFDAELRRINIEYASKRASGRLGGIELNALPAGWLEQQQERFTRRQRTSNEQFKHRYLLCEIGADDAFPHARDRRDAVRA